MDFHSSFACLLLLTVFNNLITCSDETSNKTFKPTHEWQKIEDGQTIPPGLLVRINMQTGYKEAKFPDKSDSKSLVTAPDYEREGGDTSTINPEELKKVLKKIKSDESLKDESVSGKYRTYEELKKDFSELNVKVKTDIEILTHLIENFKKLALPRLDGDNVQISEETDDEEILSTLVDLEYLVHQIDNANEFAKQNGFLAVVHKSLNSSNSEIRSEALRLHGSATQNNPKVQIAALDSGSINLLLKILSFDEDINVRSRSLYALSCLVRQFPAAQQKLITDGGLTVFASMFDEEKQDLLKLQVKILTLIHDLLFERKDTKMNILEEETDLRLSDLKERLRQYEKIDLEKKLVEQNWCVRISNWIVKQNLMSGLRNVEKDLTETNADQHDLIAKVVDTIFVLSDLCKLQFQDEKELIELIFNLKSVYSKLALTEINEKNENSGHFYSSLSNILKIIIEKLKRNMPTKDEL